MEAIQKFTGTTETEIWQQIAQDMAKKGEILDYSAEIEQQDHRIFFNIDIDLGGGFESGFETTTFAALLAPDTALRFHIYPQDWVNELGKLLGMEDVVLGYPELDAAYIIKTNQPETLKQIFIEAALSETLLKYPTVHLKLAPENDHPDAPLKLAVYFYQGITNPADLQEIYRLTYLLLQRLENTLGYKRM